MSNFSGNDITCLALLLSLTIPVSCSNQAGDSGAAEVTKEIEEFYTNRVRWTVGSEDNCFGYNVLRSTDQSGPFSPVSDIPIPGRGTTDEVKSYSFEDNRAKPGVIYYYQIQEIKLDNRRRFFPNVFRVQTKIR